MKATQVKDAGRNISKQIVSYLSVIVIAMLAVSAYLGIEFAGKAISNNGSGFYTSSNYRDVEIISTKLITPDDIEAIRSVQGVTDVEGVYRVNAKVYLQETITEVSVVSLTQSVNTVQIIDGRLPEAENECVLEKYVDDDTGLTIGDTITVLDSEGNTPKYLTRSEYVITGIVYHPDHAAIPLITPGSRYVLVKPEAFDKEALENCFMTAEVVIQKPAGIDIFSDKYSRTIKDTVNRLDVLAKDRELKRANEIKNRYQEGIDNGQADLDSAGDTLNQARTDLDNGWDKYNQGVTDLEAGKTQLAEAKQQLEDAEAQLADAKAQLDDAKEQLTSAESQLADAKDQLEYAEGMLADAKQQLDEGKEQLESTYKQIEDAKTNIRDSLKNAITNTLGEGVASRIDWAEVEEGINADDYDVTATKLCITQGITIDLNKTLKDNIFSLIASLGLSEEELRQAYEKTTNTILEIAEGKPVINAVVEKIIEKLTEINNKYEELASAARIWDEKHVDYLTALEKYNAAKTKYDNSLDQYETGVSEYNAGKAKYNDAVAQYEEGYSQYEAGLAQYAEGENSYNDGKKQLDDALVQLNDGETRYEDGLAQYNDGQAKLQTAVEEMEKLDGCKWVSLGVTGNIGYLNISNVRKNMYDLGGTFASVFILVGALVIYATVGRIIDEQKRLVGANKALGFYNIEILTKYLVFGESGTIIGMIFGAVAGHLIVQKIILSVYDKNFVFNNSIRAIHYPLAAGIFSGGLLIAGFAVWFACTSLLKSSAITLMQESVPSVKKKSSKKKSSGKGSLYAKLILFNMLSDKKRVIVTIVSIIGCCTLLVAGMTMNFAVQKTIDNQFTKIEVYNLKVMFDSTISENAESDIGNVLNDNGFTHTCVLDESVSYKANGAVRVAELVCGDMSQINDYFIRTDPKTKTRITEAGDGIWVHNKFSMTNNVKVGDEVIIYDSNMNPHQVKVCGIYTNYIGLYAFMSRETYTSVFGKEPVNNTYLIRTNGADYTEFSDKVSKVKGFMSISDIEKLSETIKALTKPLDLISLIFIGIAGMMAYFILLNLVNMYVNQKKKELTIMRINGFTVKETIRYVSLELIVSTVLGIIIGLASGALLGYRILNLLEGSNMYLVKTVQIAALGIAALVTGIYSFLVSTWALRKVKHLKLTDMA